MESGEKKEGTLATEPISQKAYREHMKNAINLLKLDHEYEKLKSEILQYKLMSYQAIEGLARYETKKPDVKEAPITEGVAVEEGPTE